MQKQPSICWFSINFYPIVSEIVYMRNSFIHELELENDCGAVETSFVFFIACFYNKMIQGKA